MNRILAGFLLLLAHGVTAQDFDQISQAVAQGGYGNVKAVVVSRRGEIIYENYFRGTGPDDLHQVQSVTKSVGSALIGIAHRQGKIRLKQDMADYFGDLYPMNQGSYASKASITVEQVLQMRHGIAWNEFSTDYRDARNPVGHMIGSPDWYQFVLTQPMASQPGADFAYSTGVSTLMSRLVRVATGMGPSEFADRELFGPLGIGPVHWEGYSARGMGFGQSTWSGTANDVPLGFSLWLRARDMLKIGELYLNGGVHEGERILDQSWIDATWTRHSRPDNSTFFDNPGSGYGYQWWVSQFTDFGGRDWHAFFASGWSSQVIIVVPELNMVLVTTADNHDYNGPDVDVLLRTILSGMNPYLDQRFNGAWVDVNANGQGLTLHILAGGATLASFWYTYDADGKQRWFVMTGQIVDGEADVTIFETRDGVFLQHSQYTEEPWGTGHFRATDCDHMTFQVESDEITTTIPLTRVTGSCFEPPG